MSDYIAKEPPGSPLPIPQETIPSETFPASDKGNSITNLETEQMEVHHHPDLHHKTRKWKEYILEFLMIFLAVTMGFIAENIREIIAEKHTEKVYMKSLVQDIQDDISTINTQQKIFDQKVILLDSLESLLDAPAIPENTADLYYYARLATKTDPFPGNTRTLDQMKNTGGFRFIKSPEIAETIMSYYAIIQQIKVLESTLETGELNEYRKIAVQIFSAHVFNQINSSSLNLVNRPTDNPPLRTSDRKVLGDLAGWVHYIKNTRIGIYQYKINLLKKGEELISLIEKD